MLADPGMIGRGLEGEIERDLEALPARGLDEPIEVRRGCRAPARSPCGRRPPSRSPTGCRDRPVCASSELFRPLRKLRPIGWIGGRYSTSNPMALTYGRRAAASSNVALRLGSVPAERGNISYHAPNRARSRSTVTPRTRSYRVARLRSGAAAIASARSVDSAAATRSPIGAPGSPSNSTILASATACSVGLPSTRLRSLEQLARHILSRPDLRGEPMPPAREPIDPAFDRVLVCAERIDDELRLPAIVAERRHRRFAPRALARAPIQQHRGKHVVPVRKHIRAHDHAFANRPLDRKPPVVHRRTDVLDHDAALKLRIKMWHGRVRNSSKVPGVPRFQGFQRFERFQRFLVRMTPIEQCD